MVNWAKVPKCISSVNEAKVTLSDYRVTPTGALVSFGAGFFTIGCVHHMPVNHIRTHRFLTGAGPCCRKLFVDGKVSTVP